MKTKLRVKTESLPERCEICHQSDLFNPQTGYCERCRNIPVKIEDNGQLLNRPVKQPGTNKYANSLLLGILWLAITFLILISVITFGTTFGTIGYTLVMGIIALGTVAVTYLSEWYQERVIKSKDGRSLDLTNSFTIIKLIRSICFTILALLQTRYVVLTGINTLSILSPLLYFVLASLNWYRLYKAVWLTEKK